MGRLSDIYAMLSKHYVSGFPVIFVGCYTKPVERAVTLLVEPAPLPQGFVVDRKGPPVVGDVLEWNSLSDVVETQRTLIELMLVTAVKPDGHRYAVTVERGHDDTDRQNFVPGDRLYVHVLRVVPPTP